MLREFIERNNVGRRDEQEIDDDTEQDEEDIEQEDGSYEVRQKAGKQETVGCGMVLDDRGDSEDHELIEVCPLTSTETIEMAQINDELEVKERKDIKNLLQKFKDVLTTLPGYSKDEEHVINTTTSEPVRAKLSPT